MSPRHRSRSTILVVDDEPAVLNLVKVILEAAGYAVLGACSGQEALALCQNQNHLIDLLLTDIDMPDVSGPELVCEVSKPAFVRQRFHSRKLKPNVW
jgi:CheY-like chemotaxis protein